MNHAPILSARSWSARVALELSVLVAAIGAAGALGWWALYPAALVIGTRAHALVILGHIGAHRLNGYRSIALSDFITRWFAMGAAGMDLDRYRRFHAMHHTFISQVERDPETEAVEKFKHRWAYGYHWTHTLRDLAGLHADEILFLIKALSSPKAYAFPAVLLAGAAVFAPIGALAFLLSPYVGAITAHRLRAWTEHDHFHFPGHTYTMPQPALWRRIVYLPHLQWKHAEHHGGPSMPKPFDFP